MESRSYIYLDIDGEQHCRSEWDYHHPFSKGQMNGNERKWSDIFKLPIFKIHHNLGKQALHSQVPNCPKPNRELMQLLRFHDYAQDPNINVYDRFINMVGYVETIAETTENPELHKNALRVVNNLQQQAPFILLGQVEIVEL